MLKFTRPRGIRLALSTGVLALAAVGGLATTASPASASVPPVNALSGPRTLPITGNEGLYAYVEPGCAKIDVSGLNFPNPAPGLQYIQLFKEQYVYMNGQFYDDPQQVGFAEATPGEDSSKTTYHFSQAVSTGGYIPGTYFAVSYDSYGRGLESAPVYC